MHIQLAGMLPCYLLSFSVFLCVPDRTLHARCSLSCSNGPGVTMVAASNFELQHVPSGCPFPKPVASVYIHNSLESCTVHSKVRLKVMHALHTGLEIGASEALRLAPGVSQKVILRMPPMKFVRGPSALSPLLRIVMVIADTGIFFAQTSSMSSFVLDVDRRYEYRALIIHVSNGQIAAF